MKFDPYVYQDARAFLALFIILVVFAGGVFVGIHL